MRLNERVCHCAETGYAVLLLRQDGRGAGKARYVARSRRGHSRFGAVGAAHPEVHQQLVRSRDDATRRFGRNERMDVQNVDESAFDYLSLR